MLRLGLARHVSLPLVGSAVLCLGALPGLAQGNNGGTILVLKNPTPRDPDPDLLFKVKPNGREQTDRASRLATYNQQRLMLIRKAAAQLTTLSSVLDATLDKALAHESAAATLASETQLAAAIEMLAGNVHNALAGQGTPVAGASGSSPAPAPPHEEAQLRSMTQQMASCARDLQIEADRVHPDTLSLVLLQRSAELRALAHQVRQGLGSATPVR